jgi:hypothetical protein
MYTSEVRWTDRVFAFNSYHLKYIADQNVSLPDSGLLYSTLTGDPGDPLYFPLNGFQWQGEEGRLAVRVQDHGTDHARIELFLFGEGALQVGMKPFMLRSAMYRVSLTSAQGVVQYTKDVYIEQGKSLLSLPLKAQQPVVLMIGPV